MDASKLRNSCICGNTLPYLECCGPYAEAAGRGPDAAGARSGEPAVGREGEAPGPAHPAGPQDADANLYYAFRHGLHELSMALFPLRSLYQAYWDKLSKDDYPHDLLMGDSDYGRAVMENFFWDYFVQYSDARPILRAARDIEGKDLRLSHDLMQWSYAPLWFYWVEERTPREARLRNPGSGKTHLVRHEDRLPPAGDAVLARLLPFRGREYCGHAVLALGNTGDTSRLEALFRGACRDLRVKPATHIRPDVHGEEWRRHGGAFLALWRAETYDARVGRASRPPAAVPPLVFRLGERESLGALSGLRAGWEAAETGVGTWDLRYRNLKTARLDARASALTVTLVDGAFRESVLEWLRGRMPSAAPAAVPAAAPAEISAGDDEWLHLPLEALNGQTPIQASSHDWGRRRLHLLLSEMAKQGRDPGPLRARLGL